MNTCVILLNWNGWRDTIECLESVLRLNAPCPRVIVCDNASTDGSLERIKNWARGEISIEPANPNLSYLVSPPVSKPIAFHELSLEQAESGHGHDETQLTLIQNGANLGFAGGNNVGLRWALADPGIQYCWMLNNDTVVERDALGAMVREMELRPELGLCGSLTLSYFNPKEVQAEGGRYYSLWTGRVPHVAQRTVDQLDSAPARMNYVNGASMLASRAFLERVGLMDESYFLYFEEMDWAMRAKGRFVLGYARLSVIYHKEGASIGSNRDRKKRSLMAEEYSSRNRMLFTKRYATWALPTVFASLCAAAAYRFCTGDLRRATTMLKWGVRGLFEK